MAPLNRLPNLLLALAAGVALQARGETAVPAPKVDEFAIAAHQSNVNPAALPDGATIRRSAGHPVVVPVPEDKQVTSLPPGVMRSPTNPQ
jgi:hypothetical protein